MPLLDCWECASQISDTAETCPKCGASQDYYVKRKGLMTKAGTCVICEGNGICDLCKGQGSYETEFEGLLWNSTRRVECGNCRGNGKCGRCSGTGKSNIW